MLIPRCQCQDFEMTFKMCSIKNNDNNPAQKLKEITGPCRKKIELQKNV